MLGSLDKLKLWLLKKKNKFGRKPFSYQNDDNPDSLNQILLVTGSMNKVDAAWTCDREMVLPVEINNYRKAQALLSMHLCRTALYTNLSTTSVMNIYVNGATANLIPALNGSLSDVARMLKKRYGGVVDTIWAGNNTAKTVLDAIEMIPYVGPVVKVLDDIGGPLAKYIMKKRSERKKK